MQYEQQQGPLKTVITIKSIVPSDKVPVFNVETMEGEGYQFWKTKADGTKTVAFQQFEKKRFLGGDRLEIYYQEKEGKPYINKYTNKEVTPINRIITKFVVDGENNPVIPKSTNEIQKPQESVKSCEIEISKMREDILKLTGRVKSLEIMLNAKQSVIPDIVPVEEDLSNIPF